MRLVYVKVIKQPRCNVIDRANISALEQTTRQPSKPPCHLMEPRPVLRGKRHHMRMGRIAQERPPRRSPPRRLGKQGESAPCGHEAAHLQAPVGMEMIDDPVRAWHGGEWPDDVGQRCGAVRTGACGAAMPPHRAGRHHTGGPHDPHPMADGLGLTCLRFPRLGRRRGIGALEHLPPRLCVDTADQASLLGEAQGVDRKLPEVPRRGLERRGMTLEPGHAPRRFAIGGGAWPPEG
jgi:hypothetical protein